MIRLWQINGIKNDGSKVVLAEQYHGPQLLAAQEGSNLAEQWEKENGQELEDIEFEILK